MRIGTNPLKEAKQKISTPSAITVGVLNYIPAQSGYFREQLDSLALCLVSLRAHADQPFDLLVVDNGSCAEARSYLLEEWQAGRIDTLILNEANLGKMNAQMQILRAAPGDFVFYSDGDIYYRPGWMQAHLDVLNAFPEAGLVGGVPLHNLVDYHTAGTQAWVGDHHSEIVLEQGDLIPEEWTREFFHSIGTEYRAGDWNQKQDWRITRNGVTAYVGASHMQFLTSRRVIERIPNRRFEFALEPEEDAHFDRSVAEAGFLRLSVSRPTVYHIGNSISEDWLKQEYQRLVQASPAAPQSAAPRRRHWFWGRSKVRRILLRIYEWAFDLHYRNSAPP